MIRAQVEAASGSNWPGSKEDVVREFCRGYPVDGDGRPAIGQDRRTAMVLKAEALDHDAVFRNVEDNSVNVVLEIQDAIVPVREAENEDVRISLIGAPVAWVIAVKNVVAFPPSDNIFTRAAIETVISLFAEELIVTVTPKDPVVTVTAIDYVRTVAVSVIGVDDIVTLTAVNDVTA
nr:hypothetical protein [Jannaschia aquimarina]